MFNASQYSNRSQGVNLPLRPDGSLMFFGLAWPSHKSFIRSLSFLPARIKCKAIFEENLRNRRVKIGKITMKEKPQ